MQYFETIQLTNVGIKHGQVQRDARDIFQRQINMVELICSRWMIRKKNQPKLEVTCFFYVDKL